MHVCSSCLPASATLLPSAPHPLPSLTLPGSLAQAAWKLLTKRFRWITATCCGTHVLALELKDMAKLPEVLAIITKVGLILSLFWGRKRWPRKRLLETIAANHGGKQFGLYRAKQTRFAGTFLSHSFLPPDLSLLRPLAYAWNR